jgi:hypothetical protein
MQGKLSHSPKVQLIFLIIGTVLGWFAVVFQLYLSIVNRITLVPETIVRFFSYFTILVNILVALCFTFNLLRSESTQGRFFARPGVQTALAVYIAVVGLTYNVVLRSLWSPQGLQYIVDELLHSILPVWFILYWLLFVPKQSLTWKDVFPWMIFPAVYCVYTLLRGSIGGFYPYPFMDVHVLGYQQVFFNVGGMIVLFLIISLLLVGIGKLNKR